MERFKFNAHYLARAAVAVSLVSAGALWSATVPAADDAEARAQQNWRSTIVRTEVPAEGCFYSAYPNTQWEPMGCAVAPVVHRSGHDLARSTQRRALIAVRLA